MYAASPRGIWCMFDSSLLECLLTPTITSQLPEHTKPSSCTESSDRRCIAHDPAPYHSKSPEFLDCLPGVLVPQQTYPAPSPGFTPFAPVQFYYKGLLGVNIGKIYEGTQAGHNVYDYARVVGSPLSVLQTGTTTVLNILVSLMI